MFEFVLGQGPEAAEGQALVIIIVIMIMCSSSSSSRYFVKSLQAKSPKLQRAKPINVLISNIAFTIIIIVIIIISITIRMMMMIIVIVIISVIIIISSSSSSMIIMIMIMVMIISMYCFYMLLAFFAIIVPGQGSEAAAGQARPPQN